MSFILRFLAKNGLLVFFAFLQIISWILIFTKNSVQRSIISAHISAVNSWASGYIDEGANYLKLSQVNEDLVAQNKMLMQQLYGKNDGGVSRQSFFKNVPEQGQSYSIIDAEIVQNSINRNNNYFTINKGKRHGIQPKMGIIAPQGIAGIVVSTTDNYALVQSVLSTDGIKINVSLKNTGDFGTLAWEGKDARIMNLTDIPKYVPIKVGDTVVTGGQSTIFPTGIMVGKVAGYAVDEKTGAWDISIEMSQKLGQTQKVFVVKNLRKEEVEKVEQLLENIIKEDDK